MQKLRTRYEAGALGPSRALKKLRNDIKRDAARFSKLLIEFDEEYGLLFDGDNIKEANAKYIDDALVDQAYSQFNALYFKFLDEAESSKESEVERLTRQLREEKAHCARVLKEIALRDITQNGYITLLLQSLNEKGVPLTEQEKNEINLRGEKLKQYLNEHATVKEELRAVKDELEKCRSSGEEGIVRCRTESLDKDEQLARLQAAHLHEINELRAAFARRTEEYNETVRTLKLNNAAEIDQFRSSLTDANEQLTQLGLILDQQRVALSETESRAATSEYTLSNMRKDYENLQQAKRSSDEQMQELEAHYNQLMITYRTIAGKPAAPEVDTVLQERMTELENQLQNTRDQLLDVTNALSTFTAENRQLQEQNIALEASLRQAGAVANEKSQRLIRAERLLQESDEKMQNTTYKMTIVVAELEEAKQRVIEMQQINLELDAQLKKQEEKVTKLKKRLDEERSLRAAGSPSKLQDVRKARELYAEVTDLRERNQQLQVELAIAETKVTELSKSVNLALPGDKEQLVDDLLAFDYGLNERVIEENVQLRADLESMRPLLDIDWVVVEEKLRLLEPPYNVSTLVAKGNWAPIDFVLVSRATFNDLYGRAKRALIEITTADTMKHISTGMSLGQAVSRLAYETLAKQPLNGAHRLKLAFRDSSENRRLELAANDLAPRILHEGAAPEMVANVGAGARGLEYKFVTGPDRDLIPASGSLSWRHYDGALLRNEASEPYALSVPPSEVPYGTAVTHEFSDGTRLYATYVTASLYSVTMFVTPFHHQARLKKEKEDESDDETV